MTKEDLISRQAAIAEIEYELKMINSALDSITLDFNTRERLRQRRGEAREILNSIQQLPSSQPDLSSYSDKLWRSAYERGKAEAQAEIIRCRDCKWWGCDDETGDVRVCHAAKHGHISSHWEISIRRTYRGDFYCADAERRADGVDS